jgi:VanZ family protein
MNLKSFLPATAWLLTSIFLLALPSNDLPHSRFFDIPFFDKYVHFGMFFLLTALFSYPFIFLDTDHSVIKAWFYRVSVYVIGYGILMEFVQKFLNNGRSFDLADIVFDSLGSVAGLLLVSTVYKNKIGPNRNRGRNQN